MLGPMAASSTREDVEGYIHFAIDLVALIIIAIAVPVGVHFYYAHQDQNKSAYKTEVVQEQKGGN